MMRHSADDLDSANPQSLWMPYEGKFSPVFRISCPSVGDWSGEWKKQADKNDTVRGNSQTPGTLGEEGGCLLSLGPKVIKWTGLVEYAYSFCVQPEISIFSSGSCFFFFGTKWVAYARSMLSFPVFEKRSRIFFPFPQEL